MVQNKLTYLLTYLPPNYFHTLHTLDKLSQITLFIYSNSKHVIYVKINISWYHTYFMKDGLNMAYNLYHEPMFELYIAIIYSNILNII